MPKRKKTISPLAASAGLVSGAPDSHRLIFETSPHGIIFEDAAGVIVDANPAASHILGRTRDMLIGMTNADAVWGAVRADGSPFPADEHPVSVALRTAHPVPATVMGLRHGTSGGRVWISVAATPLPASDAAAPDGVMAWFVDVTQQTHAELLRQESQALLERAEKVALFGSFEIHLRTQDVRASAGAARMYGLAGDAWTYAAIKTIAFAEDRPRLDAAMVGLVQRGETYDVTYRIRRHDDGAVRTLRAVCEYDRATETVFGAISDETAHMQAEAVLRASEVRYRGLFDAMREGFALHEIITDEAGTPVDYRFLEVNPAFEAMTGLRRADVVGRRVLEVMPATEPRWVETYGHVALNGGTIEFEEYAGVIGKWYRVVAFQPAPRQFATLVTDVTTRRQAESALRESEARYRMLSENAGDVIWLLDLATSRFEYVSPSVERLRGFTPAEVMAQPMDLAMTPESADRVGRLVAVRAAGFVADDPATTTFTDEVDQTCKDGSVVPTEVVTRYLPGPDRRVAKILGVSRDISQRRRAEAALRASEERFQKAFRSSPVMMTLSDLATGRFLDVNDSYCTTSGFSREESIGRTSIEVGWVSAEVRDMAVRAMQETGRVSNLEIRVRTRAGDELTVLMSGEVLELEGRPCWLVIATDITDRKRMELERVVLETQVQHLKRMESIGRLAGGVAHDMNNVLTAILTLAELQALEAVEGTSLHEDMETIAQACLRGQATVRGLLDFARADVAKMEVLDLNTIVRGEVALLQRTTLQKVRLVTELDEGLPAVRGDRAALTHVLMNLCLNAVDAMAHDGVVSVRTMRDGASHVLVEVVDTGHGMPADVLERALDPFFTTKPQGKGTGLGLSIVFGTVKAHGGTMTIRSTPGEGTTVAIRLPVAADAAADQGHLALE